MLACIEVGTALDMLVGRNISLTDGHVDDSSLSPKGSQWIFKDTSEHKEG